MAEVIECELLEHQELLVLLEFLENEKFVTGLVEFGG